MTIIQPSHTSRSARPAERERPTRRPGMQVDQPDARNDVREIVTFIRDFVLQYLRDADLTIRKAPNGQGFKVVCKSSGRDWTLRSRTTPVDDPALDSAADPADPAVRSD